MVVELSQKPATLQNKQAREGDVLFEGPSPASPTDRLDDLAQIIHAYNDAAEKLQHTHETLKAEVVRLQAELISTNAKLQRSKRLAALGEMAAGIAHEIRNPLGAIQLYAGVLVADLSRPLDGQGGQDELARTARKIASAVRSLDAIVHDVLAFARELSLRPAWVPVSSLFSRVLEACRPLIDAVGVTVVRGESGGGAVKVYADEAMLQQALLNLVRNALDAMADQRKVNATGEAPRLTLGVRREGPVVVITVRDTGPGIAEKDVDRIFNPFFTTRNSGTGLGLAIVHRLIDAHGGTIGVHNDGGAVFELSLPAGVEDGREVCGEADPGSAR